MKEKGKKSEIKYEQGFELSEEEVRENFIYVINNSEEPFASEFRAIFEKYPHWCEERARLVTDVIERSYAKL